MQKVEVKQILEEKLQDGMEIAGVLIDAAKESPVNLDDSSENGEINKDIDDDEEDTVDEAPSIVDEALGKEVSFPSCSRSSTGGSSSSSYATGADRKPSKEGEEISKILATAKLENEAEENRKKLKPMSHFKAMALVGKLFFDFGFTKSA